MANKSYTSKNNNKSKANSAYVPLKMWHIHGLAKRLGCTVSQLPSRLDNTVARNKNKFFPAKNGEAPQPYQWPAKRTMQKLKLDGESFRKDVLLKLINIVNAEMELSGLAEQIPKIDMEWMLSPNPDIGWRQHVPDYVSWSNLVDTDHQNTVEAQLCGIYFLYRPHGFGHKPSTKSSLQRELICIHPPVEGHIRVHRINKNGAISSGLGYREGNVFTIALYRRGHQRALRSSFLMIHNRAKRSLENKAPQGKCTNQDKPKILRTVINRSSDSGGAYASGALLVRQDSGKYTEQIQGDILRLLREERAKGVEIWDTSTRHTFSQFKPQQGLAWDAPELDDDTIKPHIDFLKRAVFRLDDF